MTTTSELYGFLLFSPLSSSTKIIMRPYEVTLKKAETFVTLALTVVSLLYWRGTGY